MNVLNSGFAIDLALPDLWQQEAVRQIKAGRAVIVDAPTGAGKTYIFELLVEGGYKGQAVYTVPTRALANDKYAEWKARGWRVGITTGDLCVDPGASIVVATLEAVQGQIGAPALGPTRVAAADGSVALPGWIWVVTAGTP